MSAADFKDYILGFIFFKYLSEKMEFYADKILEADDIKYLEILTLEDAEEQIEMLNEIRKESVENIGYFIAPSELFSQITQRGNSTDDNFIIDDLAKIFNNIEQSASGQDSEDDFLHLFEELKLDSTKLGETPEEKNELVVKIMTHLDDIPFKLADTQRDLLGDAYEYLIAEFAASAGKKAGEFYTPQEVSMLVAKIVATGKDRLKSVYDPTCGSGSLLLRVKREVGEVSEFFGQEMNRTTYNLARMNMILHDVGYRDFDIQQGDTIEKPKHLDKRFEAIVANPPFSMKWSANDLFLNDDRYSQAGKLPPKSNADYAFIQHMIHQLDENGTAAIVLPHGALFRSAAERHIRRYLIENRNYIDTVIGLPSNMFFGTSIPACIMVFKKCRTNPDDILFIDASKHFVKGKQQNYLGFDNMEKIIEAYRDRKTIDKFSYVASLDEVAENDYNLNIPRYVDTFEEEEPIDLKAVSTEIKNIDNNINGLYDEIGAFCDELNINKPFGV
jgi:type I restriction enzyme M protein